MADYRYLQAWAKPPSRSVSNSSSNSAVTTRSFGSFDVVLPTTTASASSQHEKSSFQVRLDTPGGITYAPDILSQHNSSKRLFIPESALPEYDFDSEIDQRKRKAKLNKQQKQQSKTVDSFRAEQSAAFAVGDDDDEDQLTDAQKYMEFVKNDPVIYDLARTITSQPIKSTDNTAPNDTTTDKHPDRFDVASILTTDTSATSRSTMSRLITLTVAAERDGSLPASVSHNATIVSAKLPASVGGNGAERSNHRALDRPSDKERRAGITNFEDISGQGNAPSVAEAGMGISTSDGDTIKTTRTAKTIRGLRVEHLFVPDPRPWRPLRYVRKVDPRQLLLLTAASALPQKMVAAYQAGFGDDDTASVISSLTAITTATAMRHPYTQVPDYETLKAQIGKSTPNTNNSINDGQDLRAGLGFVYCPSYDPRASPNRSSFDDDAASISTSTTASPFNPNASRVESNFSRRLERPPEFQNTTKRRAALRSVLAALEYNRWEEEGFDKIVIATQHKWLVNGIVRNIWEWRHNDWKLSGIEGPLGMPGEMVPDRDLWELLDKVVREYEEIDCTVRFWHLPVSEFIQAQILADQGVLKDNQQPTTVRWTKKKKTMGRT